MLGSLLQKKKLMLDRLSMTNLAALTLPEFGVPFPWARHRHRQGFHPGMQGAGMSPNPSTVHSHCYRLKYVFTIRSSFCVEGNMLSARQYLWSSGWRLSAEQAGAVTPSQAVCTPWEPTRLLHQTEGKNTTVTEGEKRKCEGSKGMTLYVHYKERVRCDKVIVK